MLGFDADLDASADGLSPSSAKSLRVSPKLLPYFCRNASCGACEHQDANVDETKKWVSHI